MPDSLVLKVCTTPVLTSETFTTAFGITAPLGSVTLPLMVPKTSWPNASVGQSARTVTTKYNRTTTALVFLTIPSSRLICEDFYPSGVIVS
jgi:hypothetical protein